MSVFRKLQRLRDEFTGRARKRDLDVLRQSLSEEVASLRKELEELRTVSPDLRAAEELVAMRQAAEAYREHPLRDGRINEHIRSQVERAGIREGRVLEIGARNATRIELFDQASFDYQIMDLDPELGTIQGDITDCSHVEDATFDVVVSVDVFEHLTRPWDAAREIIRILRPRGLSYTSTLFSWRYHPCPIDYWRFSPACLSYLFSDLEEIEAGFDDTERRRDIRKKSIHDPFKLDILGGWRENVRVFHVAKKL